MATIAEQLTSLAETKTAIKEAIVAKGVSVADTDTFRSYATKIGEISGGGGAPATKYGVSIDNLLGDVDENGVLRASKETFEINGTGIKDVGAFVLMYKFYSSEKLTSANFNDLTAISGSYACNGMFDGCSGLTSTGLKNLTTISGSYACTKMFNACVGLTSPGLESLTTISGSYACSNMFSSCSGLTSTGLKNLTTIDGSSACGSMFYVCNRLTSTGVESLTTISGSSACTNMFAYCKELAQADFPSLTTVSNANAMGSASYNGMFSGCTKLLEIHFRADAQAVIEALSGYASKFGATNATIYFDLIGTITVGGVAYARNEPNSIRVDGTKTHVAWADESGNIVYTDATSEPAVGTVVYSDAGTTQVGTVEGVA